MIRFFSDIDHTLIYSHRNPIGSDKVAVEYYNGEQQSFMTRHTYEFFSEQKIVDLIPVTTRSKVQYERIDAFGNEIYCKYALICNGGVLLVDRVEDEEWLKETEAMISQEIPELMQTRETVRQLLPEAHIRDVSGLYFYFKHDTPQLFAEKLKQLLQPKYTDILFDKRKVYCLPSLLNKGTAIRRFKEKYGDALTVAAGDSEFDIPMLINADVKIIPSEMSGFFPDGEAVVVTEEVFSDGICKHLSDMI